MRPHSPSEKNILSSSANFSRSWAIFCSTERNAQRRERLQEGEREQERERARERESKREREIRDVNHDKGWWKPFITGMTWCVCVVLLSNTGGV